MYMPINPIGYSCIKKSQRDNLLHAYNEPINFYSAYISYFFEILLKIVISFENHEIGGICDICRCA